MSQAAPRQTAGTSASPSPKSVAGFELDVRGRCDPYVRAEGAGVGKHRTRPGPASLTNTAEAPQPFAASEPLIKRSAHTASQRVQQQRMDGRVPEPPCPVSHPPGLLLCPSTTARACVAQISCGQLACQGAVWHRYNAGNTPA
uniref:Uncharacterized protein n=1 Tax=Eutreptiella gymnastica TaxID=73025 RepID=A0A7S4D2G0_9EUGL|mmetsp:Transcript_47946/g.80520  ORF Transcript_47946/g.80520 Transcript_47946/m.80520 type:complete len:143 (+) Transcript_47946:209-637(+)|eukprot:CAMPEP_0174370140 /NCGR_PEP_ID=MMETSP0811_2-20130205/95100_1 /TAXON_ID=73025 ORGANISM="Eutreptiella gymnastica-like, Strain CCMP1594" /NCGR_SAMPLE_ID=MMETSP0811_2 /ASSEMBLY_ACC=CAM_ASM_000667 /LENGTH=142 /DNA_ID=CAMNT_0015515263 /DNA_START=220 /DNA_END=648 /DNA_ORIENTATION=-